MPFRDRRPASRFVAERAHRQRVSVLERFEGCRRGRAKNAIGPGWADRIAVRDQRMLQGTHHVAFSTGSKRGVAIAELSLWVAMMVLTMPEDRLSPLDGQSGVRRIAAMNPGSALRAVRDDSLRRSIRRRSPA